MSDLSCALRLWNRNGVWSSFVTLDGDVVTADGILVGGAHVITSYSIHYTKLYELPVSAQLR